MRTSISFPQMEKLHSTLVERGVDSVLLQDLLGSGVFSDIAEAAESDVLPLRRDEFRKAIGLLPLAEEPIEIDPSMALQEMINAAAFDHVDGRIGLIPETKRPSGPTWLVIVRLIQLRLNFRGSMEKHLEEITRLGFRAGTVDELLSFAATRPKEQIASPIIALGTKFFSDGRPAYAYLEGTSAGLRSLMVCNPNAGFSHNWRFLVARPKDIEYQMPKPKLRGPGILGTGSNGGGAG